MRGMDEKRKLQEWAGKLESKIKTNAIVLFGSTVKGQNLPQSDIDILIISEQFRNTKPEDRVKLILESWTLKRPPHPVCLTPQEAMQMTSKPLIWEICRTHKIIVDDGTFQKIKQKAKNYMETNRIERKKYWYIRAEANSKNRRQQI